jgi:CRISPR-associated protein Cmr6
MLDVLFGRESREGETEHVRGALAFWDVIPRIEGDALLVDIMTPHQTHYYQQHQSPHESGQPNPISFLTVPPRSGLTFVVTCDLAHLDHLAPDVVQDGRWKSLLQAAFTHAFDWLGFGAKTAVGYGQMERNTKVEEAAKAAAAERKQEAEIAALTQEERGLRELRGWFEEDKKNNIKEPGGRLANRLGELLGQAGEWPQPARAQLAELAEEIYGYVGWGKGEKKTKRRDRIQALREQP